MTMSFPSHPLRHAALALATGLCVAMTAPSAALAQGSGADASLQAVADLAQLNGEALACQDSAAVRRAKALMLTHAPKTARYASAFDDGTQAAFLAVTRSASGCTEPATRATRLDALAQRLAQLLPAAAASQ
jgi:hypothetical protein